MKKLFYIFLLLFANTIAGAQQAVNYVSFFPPAHVVHSNVELLQHLSTSFTKADARGLTSNPDINTFHTKPGGLILGAAPNAVITIKEMDVISMSETPNSIGDFLVDNIIKVSGPTNKLGQIKDITLGEQCEDADSTQCKTFFLSAGNIKFPSDYYNGASVPQDYPNGLQVNVMSSGLANIEGVYYSCSDTNDDAIIDTCKNLIPDLSPEGNYTLEWVNLRLKGQEECRKYLVRDTRGIIGDKCVPPSGQ